MTPKIREILEWRAKYGMLEMDELEAITECLLTFNWGLNDIIVEIGSYKGRTVQMMAAVLATVGLTPKIVSIDAFDRVVPVKGMNCRGSYDQAAQNIVSAGLGKQSIIISAFSDDAVDFIPARVGFLIIDGWHDYRQCHSDLVNYTPKLLPGAHALVDDYCSRYPGVIDAVDKFAARNEAGVELAAKLNKGVILRKV